MVLKFESGGKHTKYRRIKIANFTIQLGKSWLQVNDIEMYSRHNGGKSADAKRFISTFRTKFANT